MNTTVISETELEAQDQDKDDVLFYTLQEVTLVSAPSSLLWAPPPAPHPGASSPAESPTSLGCQQLLLPGGCEPTSTAAGPVTGLGEVAEHDLPAAGPGEQATPTHGPARGLSPQCPGLITGRGCCRTHRRRPRSPDTQPQPPWSWRCSPSTCGPPGSCPAATRMLSSASMPSTVGLCPPAIDWYRGTPRSRVAGARGLAAGGWSACHFQGRVNILS